MIQTLAPYGALLMAFTVEWYVTHHTSSFLLLLFGPFSPVVWLIPLYILRTLFGHIYFTVVFHLSPVVRGPACSFITMVIISSSSLRMSGALDFHHCHCWRWIERASASAAPRAA